MIAQCYTNLSMYEDALQYSCKALKLDPKHFCSIFIKAESLAFLHRFDESIKIFKETLNRHWDSAIRIVNELRE